MTLKPGIHAMHAAMDAMQGPGDGEWPVPDARGEAARRPDRQPTCVEAWPVQWRGNPETARGCGAGAGNALAGAPFRDVNRGARLRWKS